MSEPKASRWNAIYYRAGADGRPVEPQIRSAVLDLVESGFTTDKAPQLTRISDAVSIEVRSRAPSEASSSSSEGDVDDWEDVEPDEEALLFRSLIDEKPFSSLAQMCSYDRSQYQFDFVATRRHLGLDFLESIKLVNYVRDTVRDTPQRAPQITSKADFEDEKFLKPILEDDAVLFNLDDLEPEGPAANTDGQNEPNRTVADTGDSGNVQQYTTRIAQLERALRDAQDTFLRERSVGLDATLASSGAHRKVDDQNRYYFNSYSFRDIHEEMLKDTARTEAYRDFIYENKHLFAGKIVLDVGCGTGILSLFAAKAGAKHVYAVDNSDIIDKAREIAYVNGMQDVVTCLRGMVEEISLPVAKVDIIVSEWMGYALLYEAMLDSVLFARDKWLQPGGLMIPSEISLHVSLLANPELVVDKSDFWSDVYGFDMRVMRKGVFDGAMIEKASPFEIPGDLADADASVEVIRLDLHRASVKELTFRKDFHLRLNREIDALDGFVVWWDATFGRADHEEKVITLSTGPLATRTHWQQVKLVIDRPEKAGTQLPAGQIVHGSIEYSRLSDEHRNLEIIVDWSVTGEPERGNQHWRIDY